MKSAAFRRHGHFVTRIWQTWLVLWPMVTKMNGLPELGGLRAELRAAGAFDHHEVRSWLKLAVLGAGLAACLIAMRHVPFWVTAILIIPFAGVLSTSISMTGHEGSHKSFSKSPWRNQLLVYLAFPMFSGLGSLYWRNKHDRLHHGHPNVEGVDPDIKPFPFVSSFGDHEKSTPGLRWFQRNLQRTVFWPMSTLMALGMRRSSILYLVRYPKEHGFTKAWAADVGCLLVHYTCWMVLPILASIGTVAIGALAIGRLAIGRARIRRLEIDQLVVRKLHVTEDFQAPRAPRPSDA